MSMMADHSDPGRILKYAPKPYPRSETPRLRPITPNETLATENWSSGIMVLSAEGDETEEG